MNLIERQNPWWYGGKDHHLEIWNSMELKWVPEWIERVSLKPFSLNFIVGPRQVGKTTGLKLLISELLRRQRPESIFYFDCTLLVDLESFKRTLDFYLEMKKAEGIETSFIFLDEVTALKEWWRIIKGYLDMGLFKHDVIVVTGSSSLRLKGEVELFPGRRGYGKDVTVLPLSFREFLKVKGFKIKRWNLSEKLKEGFEEYLEVGGFPLSVNRHITAEQALITSLEGEVLRSGKSLQLVKEVIGSIMKKAPSPVSFSVIGSDIGVSYKTVQEYVELLRGLFVLDMALFKENGIKWRKERKFFFLDPFMARTLAAWTGSRYLESALYEWIVQAHLMRKYGEVYYYRNGYEICLLYTSPSPRD